MADDPKPSPPSNPSPPNPEDIIRSNCWPRKPVKVTVVNCKNHQPILIFTISQPTTGDVIPVNNGTNLIILCLLPGESLRYSANGFESKDVPPKKEDVDAGFMEVCLD